MRLIPFSPALDRFAAAVLAIGLRRHRGERRDRDDRLPAWEEEALSPTLFWTNRRQRFECAREAKSDAAAAARRAG